MKIRKIFTESKNSSFHKLNILVFLLALISLILAVRPITAKIIDSYILYQLDDISRLMILRGALQDFRVLLNPYLKPGFSIINLPLLAVTGAHPMSIRVLNFVASIATLVLVKKIALKSGFSKTAADAAVLLCFSFPVFFIMSASNLSEVLFTFMVMLSVYKLLTHNYNSALLIISLLPLFRQEGLILLPIFAVILARKISLYKTLFLIIPFIIWSFLNVVILGHEFYYSFFPNIGIIPTAPQNSRAPIADMMYTAGIFIFHPVLILGFLGTIDSFQRKKIGIILLILTGYIAILFSANILHIMVNGYGNREIRYLHLLIPLLALTAAYYADRRPALLSRMRKYAFVIPIIVFFQIIFIQKEGWVVWDYVSFAQEKQISDAASDIIKIAEKEGFRNIYIPGELYIDPVIRRIWYHTNYEQTLYILTQFSDKEGDTLRLKKLDLGLFKYYGIEPGTQGIYLSTVNGPFPPEELIVERLEFFKDAGVEAYFFRYIIPQYEDL